MRFKGIHTALAAALLALSGAAVAQTQPGSTYNAGPQGSPHCNSMTGEERIRCLNDEGAKTETKPSDRPSDAAKVPADTSPTTPSSTGASTDSENAPKIDPDTPANAYDKPKQ